MSSVVACKKIFNEQHPLIYTPINTCTENRGGINISSSKNNFKENSYKSYNNR